MNVYQCPACELRFGVGTELLEHIAIDHPSFESTSKTVEDSLLGAAHRHRHASRYRPASEKNAP